MIQAHQIRRIHLRPIHPILPLPISQRKPLGIQLDLDLAHLDLHLPQLPTLGLLAARLQGGATLAEVARQIGPAAEQAGDAGTGAPLALEARARVPLLHVALQVAGAGAGVGALQTGEQLLLQVRAGVVLVHDRGGGEAALAHRADVRPVQRVRPRVPHHVGGEAEGRAHADAAVTRLPAAVPVAGHSVLGFEVAVQGVRVGEDEVAGFEGGVEPEAFVGLGRGLGGSGGRCEGGACDGACVEG